LIAYVMATLLTVQSGGSTVPERERCGPERAEAFIDERYDERTRKALAKAMGATTTRWILPGSSVTQDWVPARVNLEVGDDGRVHKVWCG
jgi:hypothetical protein